MSGATNGGNRGVAQDSGNGDIFITNATDGSILKYDYYGRNQSDHVTGLTAPYGIAVAKDRERIVFSESTDGDIYTCDLKTGDIPLVIRTGAGSTSYHLQYAQDESRVYYTEDNDGRWTTIEGDDDTLLWTSGANTLVSIWSDGTLVIGGLQGASVGQPIYTVGGVLDRTTGGRTNVEQIIIDPESRNSESIYVVAANTADRFDTYDLSDDTFYGDVDHLYASTHITRSVFPGQLPTPTSYSLLTSSSGRDNDDFDGYSVASGLPTGWTGSQTETNISYAIITDGSSPGGQAFTIAKSPSDTSRS